MNTFIEYYIAEVSNRTGKRKRLVSGYAINSPTGVRYCVRNAGDGIFSWVADHYDTGFSIAINCIDKNDAIGCAELTLERNIASGIYKKSVDDAMEIVKELQ